MVGGRAAAAKPAPTTGVVAAAADLKVGTILTAANLTTVRLAGTTPKGAIQNPQDVIGRGVIADLYQGEPILDSRLAPKGSGGGLAATIKQGMRACAVKVDEVVGVAGFVTPGQRVDVLISGDPPNSADAHIGTRVKTLLQNIEVLSAGTDIQKDAEGKPQQVRVVNLLVSPEQAEVLSLASSRTQIQLVLRNPLDTKVANVPGSAVANLFDGSLEPIHQATGATGHGGNGRSVARSAAARPHPTIISVEIFNGIQKTEKRFALRDGKQVAEVEPTQAPVAGANQAPVVEAKQ
jgi:pilus assembly protein CpaB